MAEARIDTRTEILILRFKERAVRTLNRDVVTETLPEAIDA